MCWTAECGYVGIKATGRGKPEPQKEANRAHAKLRAPEKERTPQLKAWKKLTRLRCCPGVLLFMAQ
jgi:hypothetical protein